jgi:CheY-like chemotaxis protein
MEAIGTLAGGIAHDFNNILGAILGYTEMVKDTLPPGSIAGKDLDKVLAASHRAATLVKQILAYSRQTHIERVPLDLAPLVKEAIKLIRPSLPSTIAIQREIDTAIRPIILADPTQIHQVLMNLCTNAFHAMEQTGGILEITLNGCEPSPSDLQPYPQGDPGNFVMLSISDTGTGIESEIGARIFDPYFTTKEVGKGTGMGLAIVQSIVTSYGGFIIRENNPENGTVFRVFFPAIDQEIVPEVMPDEAAPLGNERILWVDDEVVLAELGKTMLERLGYEVTVQSSSLEALTVFQGQPDQFDAVITDQTMPGLTGMDLAKQILQIRPDIPIILCTGYSTLVNEEQARAEGIREFAMKPFTRNVMATILKRALATVTTA